MLVWEQRTDNKHYQLRQAGQSQRLYTNGVFHSQYKPVAKLNGGVWDLLWLPLFFKPADAIQRVLVLGLGSGAAVAKIHRFYPRAEIVALDIDRWHLHVARHFTGLRGRQLKLQKADAIQWVADYSGPCFDVIVDDLYGDEQGEPCRAVELPGKNRQWLRSLKKLLARDGLLVANCLDRHSAGRVVSGAGKRDGFANGWAFRQQGYQNIVVAVSDRVLDRSDYRSRLQATLGQRAGRGELKPLAGMRIARL